MQTITKTTKWMSIPHFHCFSFSLLRITLTALLVLASSTGWSQSFFSDLQLSARVGYNIGGTAPLGLPASIRKINTFSCKSNFSVGVDAEKPLSDQWGMMLGLRFENKGMETDATVKKYYMEIVKGGDAMNGYFYGRNYTEVKEWMFTVPVQLAFHPSDGLRLKFGPYLSFLTSKNFSGYAYNGYLRGNNPIGPKVEVGNEDNTRGNYDFPDDMRSLHVGLNLGVDFKFYKNLGVFADLSWGLNGIFKKDFKTVEQTLYPIYGTLGLVYQIK